MQVATKARSRENWKKKHSTGKELLWKRLTTLYLQKNRSIKSDDKTIKSGFGEKARVLEDNRDILPLLLPSVTKPTFQRIIYQLWSEWSDGETKFCIFSLELEAIFKMLFFINIDHSSNKFPPIPGYKSATIWCLLDNDESGHVNVCEHRAPRLPLLPSFKTCSPPRSPKIFSFLSPKFLNYFADKILKYQRP